MNNEPVAWLLFRDGGESYPEYTNSYKQMREWETYLGDNERIEPHYTRPADLTDEEIVDSVRQYFNIHPEAKLSEQFRIKLYELEDFARAILRKAQEK